ALLGKLHRSKPERSSAIPCPALASAAARAWPMAAQSWANRISVRGACGMGVEANVNPGTPKGNACAEVLGSRRLRLGACAGVARPTPFYTPPPCCCRSARQQAQQLAVALVGQEVDEAVGALAHIAHALVQVWQQTLLFHHLGAVEREPREVAELEGAQQQVADPVLAITFAAHKRQARGRNR